MSRRRRASPWAPTRRSLGVPAPSDVLTPTVAALVAAVLVVLGVLAAVADGDLLFWDQPIRRAIRGLGGEATDAIMRWGTKLGSRWVIGALLVPAVAIAWRRCRQVAVVLVVAFVAALGIELLLKALVARPRPLGAHGFGHSFPSGHVLAATAFWGLAPPWVYLVTRRRSLWVLAVVFSAGALAVVGMSRVYLGAHWPSDVAAGYLAGSVFLLAAEWAVRHPIPALGCDACEFHPLLDLVHDGRAGVPPDPGGPEPRARRAGSRR